VEVKMPIFSKHTLLLLALVFGIMVAEFFLLEGTMGISLPGDRSSALMASLWSFAISLRFSDGSELTLPVENDDISLRGVSIPSRFTFKTR
jgi:hypothetical protein